LKSFGTMPGDAIVCHRPEFPAKIDAKQGIA
jgi:hypothetical protein